MNRYGQKALDHNRKHRPDAYSQIPDPASFFDGALVIALLGFIGTVALAKFQLRGDIVD